MKLKRITEAKILPTPVPAEQPDENAVDNGWESGPATKINYKEDDLLSRLETATCDKLARLYKEEILDQGIEDVDPDNFTAADLRDWIDNVYGGLSNIIFEFGGPIKAIDDKNEYSKKIGWLTADEIKDMARFDPKFEDAAIKTAKRFGILDQYGRERVMRDEVLDASDPDDYIKKRVEQLRSMVGKDGKTPSYSVKYAVKQAQKELDALKSGKVKGKVNAATVIDWLVNDACEETPYAPEHYPKSIADMHELDWDADDDFGVVNPAYLAEIVAEIEKDYKGKSESIDKSYEKLTEADDEDAAQEETEADLSDLLADDDKEPSADDDENADNAEEVDAEETPAEETDDAEATEEAPEVDLEGDGGTEMPADDWSEDDLVDAGSEPPMDNAGMDMGMEAAPAMGGGNSHEVFNNIINGFWGLISQISSSIDSFQGDQNTAGVVDILTEAVNDLTIDIGMLNKASVLLDSLSSNADKDLLAQGEKKAEKIVGNAQPAEEETEEEEA